MAYRLKPAHSSAKEIARILEEQFHQVVKAISAPQVDSETVHDLRKRVKKIRAVVHMLRDPLGGEYRRLNALLRSMGRQLSVSRDADAAVESIDDIRQHCPSLVTAAAFAAVKRGLIRRQRQTRSDLRSRRLHHDLQRALKSVPHAVHHAADASALENGVVEGYERARCALRSVVIEPGDADFHRWRRRVKDHWYQLRLLEAIHPALRLRIRRLKRLERLLGSDHNLVVLRALLLQRPTAFGDQRHITLILGCIDLRGSMLRKEAMRLGKQLFRSRRPTFRISLRA